MQLTYKLEAKHFQDFSTASARELAHVNSINGQLIWGLIVGLIVAAGGIAGWAISGNRSISWAFLLGAWFFWLINYATGMFVVRRSASLAFRKEGLVLGDRQLSIDDTGVHLTGNLFSQNMSWKAFKSVSVQHLVVVLWSDTAAGIFVPRSAFVTPQDEERFVTVVKTKIDAS